MIESHRKQPELLEHGTRAIGKCYWKMEPGVTSRATKLSSSLIMAYPAYTGWSRGTLPGRIRSISTTFTMVETTLYVSSRATSAPNTPPTIAEEPAPGSVVGITCIGASESDKTISLIC